MNHLQRLSSRTICSLQELILAQNISNTNARTWSNIIDNEDHDPLEYAGGEFDADEPAEIVQAARVSKAKVSVRTGGVHILNLRYST